MRPGRTVYSLTLAVLVALTAIFASVPLAGTAQEATPAPDGATPLEVSLTNAENEGVGVATFTEGADGVTVAITVDGLAPGEHGWHLHAMGMCDPSGLEPFATAGPHWNPTGAPHGGPEADARHAGDFGNLTAGEDGTGQAELTVDTFTLGEGSTSAFDSDGTAIIIHLGEDDLVSQPAGNSGGRYACGVVAEPAAAPIPDASPQASAESSTPAPEQLPFTDDMLGLLEAPEGFAVSVFAQGLNGPRMLATGLDGTIYVTQPAANTVTGLRDTDGDGVADETEVVASDLHVVHGILLHEGRVYLAGEHEVWVADVLDDGTFGEPEAIVDDLPDGAQHGRRTIGIGPDDMLYISIGSSCNACAETDLEHATILRTSLDGGEREIFASGPRNTLGFGWHPETGELWGMDHGSDGRGDDQPPEELHRLVEGGNYGWPYCFGDQAVDRFLSRTPVGATPEQYCANTVAPVLTYQAHSAPIAMVFYEGDQFPDELQGDALVAMRGSWNRSLPTGFKVVHIDFEDGTPVAIDGFVTGWLVDDGAAQFGRIAGLTVTDNGALLVSDDTNGVIYRIAYTD
ncbi:MAG: superoxide dismutase family protein [Chloroflexota bacterium]|nr:superoxide dismutase family protein [Chloroflexota bacterium]